MSVVKSFKIDHSLKLFHLLTFLCYFGERNQNFISPRVHINTVYIFSVLQLFLSSPRPTLRFAAVRTLNKVAMTQPMSVTTCNLDLENLITDVNRSIATLAITTLLKVSKIAWRNFFLVFIQDLHVIVYESHSFLILVVTDMFLDWKWRKRWSFNEADLFFYVGDLRRIQDCCCWCYQVGSGLKQNVYRVMFMDHVKFVCGMISSTSSCCEILRIFRVEQVEVVCVSMCCCCWC